MSWYIDAFDSEAWSWVHEAFWEARNPDEAVGAIESALGLVAPARVLDVPCGNGQITRALCARGYEVVGVDRSPGLLAKARARATGATFFERDMRELPSTADFDAVICWWGSFGYFDDAGDASFARAAHGALRPGGKMIIDTSIAEGLLPVFAASGVWTLNDVWIAEERAYDMERGRIDSNWTVRKGDALGTLRTSVRLYTWRELRDLLREAGFTDVQNLDARTGKPMTLTGSGGRSHVIATK